MNDEMTDRDILLTIATMAVRDDALCAHDILETLKALGKNDVIEEARLVVEFDDDGPEDPEPDDELDESSDG